MNRNAVHAGWLTGLAVVGALFYPLYVVLPQPYVAGWQAGPPSLGLFLSLVAAVAVMVGGGLAARWGGAPRRVNGAKLGALAGAIAGTVAFAALGAAAAGTISLDGLLRYSPSLAADHEPYSLAHQVVKVANATYSALWGMPLSGALLGALGGLFAPPGAGAGEKEDEIALRIAEVFSIRLLLVSLLILIISVTSVSILLRLDSLSRQADLLSLFNVSVGSAFAVHLAILLWILRLAQHRLAQSPALFRKRQVTVQCYAASLLSILALVALFVTLLSGSRTAQGLEPPLVLNPVVLIGTLASLALSGTILKMASGLSMQLRAAQPEAPAETARPEAEARSFMQKKNIPLVAFMGGTSFALPTLTLVPLVIDLTRGVVPTFALLANFEGNSDPTRGAAWTAVAVGTVQNVFRSQALAAYGVFVLGAVSILFSLSFARGLSRLRERASA